MHPETSLDISGVIKYLQRCIENKMSEKNTQKNHKNSLWQSYKNNLMTNTLVTCFSDNIGLCFILTCLCLWYLLFFPRSLHAFVFCDVVFMLLLLKSLSFYKEINKAKPKARWLTISPAKKPQKYFACDNTLKRFSGNCASIKCSLNWISALKFMC